MKRILFVCTGNTCRSPMAELLLKEKLKKLGVRNIRVASAGLCAEAGQPMSAFSREALRRRGIRGGRFRSRRLDEKMLREQNLVLVMTASHKRALEGVPNVFTLAEFAGGGDVPDPFGGTLEDYLLTCEALDRACETILKTIL